MQAPRPTLTAKQEKALAQLLARRACPLLAREPGNAGTHLDTVRILLKIGGRGMRLPAVGHSTERSGMPHTKGTAR